jgi:hypothetical protein
MDFWLAPNGKEAESSQLPKGKKIPIATGIVSREDSLTAKMRNKEGGSIELWYGLLVGSERQRSRRVVVSSHDRAFVQERPPSVAKLAHLQESQRSILSF